MIPEEAKPPAVEQPKITHVLKHSAKDCKREVRILVAYDLNTEKREVTMNQRHYHFTLPQAWSIFDDSYKPNGFADELPGKVEVQFAAPEKDGSVIVFSYRGRGNSRSESELFHRLLQEHKQSIAPSGKDMPLTKEQIINLTGTLGAFVGNNQYAAEMDPGAPPAQFKITSADTISINNATSALAVSGEWRNNPKTTAQAEQYWYKIYLDGTDNGVNVHEILYSSNTKDSFEKHKAVFDQMLKSLSW